MEIELNSSGSGAAAHVPMIETEADLLRKLTVTRAAAVEAEARLRETTLRRAAAIAELDAKVDASRAEFTTAHAAYRAAKQALVERVSVDPIQAAQWPGIEAVKPAPIEPAEIPDDDDYDAVLRAASGRA